MNVVAKALNANAQSEPAHIKARHEAEDADKAYRVAIRRLDRQRLGVEEKIEETLKTLQRWETERLRAVKTGKSPSPPFLLTFVCDADLIQHSALAIPRHFG